MLRLTSFSFPGTGFEERMTVSPARIVICWCVPFAIRVSAEVGSP